MAAGHQRCTGEKTGRSVLASRQGVGARFGRAPPTLARPTSLGAAWEQEGRAGSNRRRQRTAGSDWARGFAQLGDYQVPHSVRPAPVQRLNAHPDGD